MQIEGPGQDGEFHAAFKSPPLPESRQPGSKARFPSRRQTGLRSPRESPSPATLALTGFRVRPWRSAPRHPRSEEHTSELQSLAYLVCRLLLEKKKTQYTDTC